MAARVKGILHTNPFFGLCDECLDDIDRDISVVRLNGKMPRRIPENDFCGDGDLPEPISMELKPGESGFTIRNGARPIPFVTELHIHGCHLDLRRFMRPGTGTRFYEDAGCHLLTTSSHEFTRELPPHRRDARCSGRQAHS